jgi:hypothetical protein
MHCSGMIYTLSLMTIDSGILVLLWVLPQQFEVRVFILLREGVYELCFRDELWWHDIKVKLSRNRPWRPIGL